MSDDPLVAAELEFQRRLAALHRSRDRLSEVESALRRLQIDRPGLSAEVADQRQAALSAERERLADQIAERHRLAGEAHTALRRLTDPSAEPDHLEIGPPSGDFEQPPFLDPR